jgi:hypothetical protein
MTLNVACRQAAVRRAENLTTCANCLEICEPQPPETFRVCPGLNGISLPFSSLEQAVTPTAPASRFTLQYFTYYVILLSLSYYYYYYFLSDTCRLPTIVYLKQTVFLSISDMVTLTWNQGSKLCEQIK